MLLSQRTYGATVAVVMALVAAVLTPILVFASTARAATSDLFFSEYVEGSSLNKALEIYNGTGAPVDLGAGDYEIAVFFNGNTAAGTTIDLTGTIADGDVFVVADDGASAAVLAETDQTTTSNLFSGDDAIVLTRAGATVDAFGQVGTDPGSQWAGGGQNDTLRRNANVCGGDTNAGDPFDASVEYASFPSDTFDGLGAHSADCDGGGPQDPVINEFIADHTGSDTEAFIEVFGAASTDYSSFTVLEIEGDGGGAGIIDAALQVGTTDAGGFWLDDEDVENGTITLLLVEGFTGSVGNDIDADNDGTIDNTPWARIVDDVATSDGGSSDRAYTTTDLTPGYDGISFQPGGASRIPNAADTDTFADWVRNDFDGFGLPGFVGSPAIGEAVNTPGAVNEVITVPTDPFGTCGDPATLIHAIQGNGAASPDVGSVRTIEGVVVGDYQGSPGLSGFFVQEEDGDVDGDALTSEGIFVFDGGFGVAVTAGDTVRVRGSVTEFFDLTEINNVTDVAVCSAGNSVSPATITLPVADIGDWETTEGMLVNIPQTLYASGNFTQARFGEVDLSVNGPLDNPTNVAAPGAPAQAQADLNNRSRIQLDDGDTTQNPLPLPPYLGVANTLRTGDTLPEITAVLGYSFGFYELHPVGPIGFTRANLRPSGPPDVGGSMTVAAYNVLNYFTTLDNSGPICGPTASLGCRGADNVFELGQQRAKLVDALSELDAEVIGLIELENSAGDSPIADLVAGVNSVLGAGTYEYVATGAIGTDAIRVGLIYRPGDVTPVGPFTILDSSVDPAFNDTRNRPVLAQTFQENGTDDMVTVAVNHLKSKGSPCDDIGDPDTGDGQGNCNQTRTTAAQALVDWLATDPTGSGSGDALIVGDLNAYAQEDPVTTIEAGGYTDLIEALVGSSWSSGAYSFNFFSESGYLDHGLASASLLARVTGAGFWHINADEPRGLDYNDFNQPGLFNADEFRSSDHDPVIVGLCETTAPVVDVTASPDSLWPPNHRYRDVTATVAVTDADPNAAVTLVSVTSNEPDDGLGDGDTADDIVIVDDFNFQLRAERGGGGDGRIYTMTYEVTDSCGNSTTAAATVTVPLSQRLN